MKKSHLYYGLLVLLSSPVCMHAQTLASSALYGLPVTQPGGKQQDGKGENMTLKKALLDLKSTYNVSIIYESKLVEDKTVKGFRIQGSLDESLQRLLEPFNLAFKKDKHVYVIVSKQNQDEAFIPALENKKLTYYLADNKEELTSTNTASATATILQRIETGSLTITNKAITITGKVTSQEDNQGLPGVNVLVKGSAVGTTTDANGNYSLNAPDGNGTLVFSYIGYTTEEVPINNHSTINVALVADIQSLSEVVVVGYGEQRKATLTGSVASVKGTEIIQTPTTNVSNTLAGRMSGVVAVTRSGEPGYDGSTIRIRGVNSLGNNDALIVVDGIPGRSLDRIDPNSIESITVLKDASAAIYGAQAANGVILITTKRGRTGKPEITLNLNQGYGRPTRIPRMADAVEYATMLNEIDAYRNRTPRYSAEDLQKYADGSDPWRYPNTDWFSEVLKPWSGQNYGNIQISGGGENLKYFLLAGAKTQDGYYKNSAAKYSQYDFRSNLDGKISNYVNIGVDIAGRQENRNFPTRSAGSIFRMVMRGKPNMTAYWPDGTPGPDIEYGDNPVVVSTDATGYDKDTWYVLNSNVKLNIIVPWVKGLSLTSNAGIDKGFRHRKRFETPWFLYSWDGQSYDANGQPVLIKGKKGFDDPRLTQETEFNQSILLNAMLNYETSVAEVHNIKLMVGSERRSGNRDLFSAYRRFFISTTVDQMFAGGDAERNNGGTAYLNRRLNYFGRANYNYLEKYLVEFVWRYDGSFQFPKDKRFGFFPGVSAGWRISEESFWKNNIAFINNFKIRGSWGQTGNDRIEINGVPYDWQYIASYGFDPSNQTYVFGIDQENKRLREARIPNPNITWEVASQSNIGFETQLFNSKFFIEADYFYNKRSQILWPRNASVPASAGLTLPPENIGKVANQGFDFNIGYNNNINDFQYQVSVNGGYAKNKILFWDEAPGAPDYQLSTGQPMNTSLYYNAIGIFRDEEAVNSRPHWDGAKPGDIIFQDVNNDGKIDANDRVRNPFTNIPRFTGGLNLNLQFKGFDLAVLFQGAAGAVRYIQTESGDIGNFLKEYYDNRWTPENPDASGPRTFNRDEEYWRNQQNTYFLHRTDYIRLKNLQLGYSLPVALTGKLGMQNIRFYISGFNLLTYSPDLKDFDPETDNASGQSYPLQKVLNGGLTVTF
ncbi:TonB-dependent receptor [Rhodocytophaga aerolata]|uniref:TonB-dependent receptor n=1 Tax=Rhodocytophaga aerolata TaxID=455078 RepID=A0ABT8R915_9BACT|nr:TonB-dependent receptor [Rhodocytophaga aerolata]MDO1448575.1 TonB-dependent receptor [Rhodocytophaga aerolata]